MCLPLQMFALEGVCVGASYKSCQQPFWTAYLFCQKHSIFKPKLHQSQLPRFFDLTYIIANHFYTIAFASRWILFMKTDTSPDAEANARQLRIFVVLIVNIFLSLGLVFSSDACWTEFRIFFILSSQASDQQQRHRSLSQTRLKLFDIRTELMGAQPRDHPHHNEAQTPEGGRRLQMTYTLETFLSLLIMPENQCAA